MDSNRHELVKQLADLRTHHERLSDQISALQDMAVDLVVKDLRVEDLLIEPS